MERPSGAEADHPAGVHDPELPQPSRSTNLGVERLGVALPADRLGAIPTVFVAPANTPLLDARLAAALERYTARAITDPSRLRAELAEVRRRSGAGQRRGELEPALWGVSAGVVDERGVLAVASVWGAEGRLRR